MSAYNHLIKNLSNDADCVLLLQVFHDEKVLMKRSWVEADFFCQALGAQLASFHHYEEQVFLKQLLGNMFEGSVLPSGPR